MSFSRRPRVQAKFYSVLPRKYSWAKIASSSQPNKCPACLENTVHYIPTVNGPNISNGLAVPQLSYNCRVVVLLCSRIDWEEPCVARRGASTAGLKPVGPIPEPSCKNEGGGKDCLTVLDCENIWVNIVRILLNHSHQSFHWVFFFVWCSAEES